MKAQVAKHLKTYFSLALVSVFATQAAQAFLVDKSQQKTIYIGKGGAQNMKPIQVQEIVTPTEKNITRSYAQTNNTAPNFATSSNHYSYGGVNTNYNNNYNYNNTNYNNTYTPSMSSFDQLPVDTNAAAVAVFDLQTGQSIYEKNIDTQRSIASISKVMTAMVLLDANLDMNEEIVIQSSDLVGAKKASTKLYSGDRMSRSEFMLLMLMKSENPAAKALARTYPGGYDAFINAMNQKARSLGMYQTSFRDSSGLNPHNVSSANDLVKMMRVINADPRYQNIRNFSTAQSYDFRINNYNRGARTYKANNTSRLVRAGSYPIGLSKTGYIREAGYCVVMETHVNGRPAVVVILGASASNNRWNDAENILTQLAYRN